MDQLFGMAEILTPAVNALLGDMTGVSRAARERYAQSGPTGGRYGDILRGWRGQAEVIRARLSKEVMATRLNGCSGQELADLAKSEYFAELPADPQYAVGRVGLIRTVVNTSSSPSGSLRFGVIPAGTKVKKAANPAAAVPGQDAEYVTSGDVVCSTDDDETADNGDGTWTHFQELFLPIIATRQGPHANHLGYQNDISPVVVTVTSTLFDPTFIVESSQLEVAGGTLGVVDDQIRALARAMSTGSNGPTSQAAVAGALTNPGTRRAVYVDDPVAAVGRLYCADEDWCTSLQYRTKLLASLQAAPWIGWGCRLTVEPVSSYGITVTPSILLRSREYEPFQDAITANVKAALVEYFDERPDWYTWTLNAIGATVGAADDRILACIAVSVVGNNGNIVAAVDEAGVITGTQPPATPVALGGVLTHWAMTGQSVTPIYSTPGA